MPTNSPTQPYGNGPDNLASGKPAAGGEEAAALEKFMAQQASQGAPDIPAGQNPEAAALSQFQGGGQVPEQAVAEQPGLGSKALDLTGRVLDEVGGGIRSGLANVAGLASGQGIIVPQEEMTGKVLKGKAPSSEELLRRLGVPEGGSFTIPGTDMKVTARGAAGLASDIVTGGATNEFKVLGNLVKEAPYISKLFSTPGQASEALGKAIYKSAVAKVDKKLAEKGSGSVGEALLENGAPVGGPEKLLEKVQSMADTVGKVRQGLYDKATELGASIDLAHPLKRAEAVLKNMERDPGLMPAAQELRAMLSRYQQVGKATIDDVSRFKTNLYDSLPASAFDGFGKVKGQAKAFKAALAGDLRDAIVSAGNTAEKGLGDAIEKVNSKWGTLLEAQPLLNKTANVETGGTIGHIIDTTLLGSGHVGTLAAKKGLELATSPYAKTAVGNALMQAGKKGVADAAVKRALIDTARANRPQEEQ